MSLQGTSSVAILDLFFNGKPSILRKKETASYEHAKTLKYSRNCRIEDYDDHSRHMQYSFDYQ